MEGQAAASPADGFPSALCLPSVSRPDSFNDSPSSLADAENFFYKENQRGIMDANEVRLT
ncbi:hypothetical protein [Cohnella sp. GCM10012308]|uniref:hypothetical protein n=1 Tax=Cohnella sp. GCM10012308 TaxID=3317329 RepID=UPI00361C5031